MEKPIFNSVNNDVWPGMDAEAEVRKICHQQQANRDEASESTGHVHAEKSLNTAAKTNESFERRN